MKTTDEQIEKMARDHVGKYAGVETFSVKHMELTYKNGFKACEAMILAEATEDLQDFIDTRGEFTPREYVLMKQAFTAGAMSQAKRVRELEDEIQGLSMIARDVLGAAKFDIIYPVSSKIIKQGGEK